MEMMVSGEMMMGVVKGMVVQVIVKGVYPQDPSTYDINKPIAALSGQASVLCVYPQDPSTYDIGDNTIHMIPHDATNANGAGIFVADLNVIGAFEGPYPNGPVMAATMKDNELTGHDGVATSAIQQLVGAGRPGANGVVTPPLFAKDNAFNGNWDATAIGIDVGNLGVPCFNDYIKDNTFSGFAGTPIDLGPMCYFANVWTDGFAYIDSGIGDIIHLPGSADVRPGTAAAPRTPPRMQSRFRPRATAPAAADAPAPPQTPEQAAAATWADADAYRRFIRGKLPAHV